CRKVNFHAKLCKCPTRIEDGIDRRSNKEEERNDEIPCPLVKGACHDVETDPSNLGLSEVLWGDAPSAHVGQSEIAEEEWVNIKADALNKEDGESSQWENSSEAEENVTDFAPKMVDGNRQNINKDHNRVILNANVNSDKRTKVGSGEMNASLTMEERNSNFDSPKLNGNLEVVLDVDDGNNADWCTVIRKSYRGFRGGSTRR
ncbi:hypothetical protein KI387_023412, partial [Taxus chinensis]